jgi:hypothetical protein
MKKTNKMSLTVALILSVALFITIFGCKKSDLPASPAPVIPKGGDTAKVTYPPTGGMAISFTGNPERLDTPFNAEKGYITCSASSDAFYARWYSGVDTLASGNSANFLSMPLTASTTYSGIAKGSGGTSLFSLTTKAPFSVRKGDFCQGNRIFKADTLKFVAVADSGSIPATGWTLWQDGRDHYRYIYQTNNLVNVLDSNNTNLGTRAYYFLAGETQLWEGPGNVWGILTSSITKYTLVQWRKDGIGQWWCYRETYVVT